MPNEKFFLVCLIAGLVAWALNRPSPAPPRLPLAVAHIASASPGPGLRLTRRNSTCPPNAEMQLLAQYKLLPDLA
jgi:hypothetical protein